MNEEQRRILDMLESNKINAAEAERLLGAIGGGGTATATATEPPPAECKTECKTEMAIGHVDETGTKSFRVSKAQPGQGLKNQYLRVVIQKHETGQEAGESLDLRIPIRLLKSGVNLATLLPDRWQSRISELLKRRGFHPEGNETIWDTVVEKISEIAVDVDNPQERIQVYCEE
jgi:hypothetical protein